MWAVVKPHTNIRLPLIILKKVGIPLPSDNEFRADGGRPVYLATPSAWNGIASVQIPLSIKYSSD